MYYNETITIIFHYKSKIYIFNIYQNKEFNFERINESLFFYKYNKV
jgi:hypothetical protein